jgi:hypothetical protein
MPVTVKEDWEGDALSYGSGGGSEGLHFNIHDASSKYEAWSALKDYSSALYLGLVRNSISVTQVGPTFFKGVVQYGPAGPGGGDTANDAAGGTPATTHSAPADATTALGVGYEFTFSAEMVRRTQSLETRYRRAIGDALNVVGTAPDYERAVGVSRSGGNVKVDGYEAPEPSHVWSRTVPVFPMTLEYRDQIRSCVGKKNADPFYNAEAGETVLWGVSGRHEDGGRYSLTFTFHERENVTNLILRPDPADPTDATAANALVVPFASGWDHIWVVYEEQVDGNELLKRPIQAYVETIIDDADFSVLRIGS